MCLQDIPAWPAKPWKEGEGLQRASNKRPACVPHAALPQRHHHPPPGLWRGCWQNGAQRPDRENVRVISNRDSRCLWVASFILGILLNQRLFSE